MSKQALTAFYTEQDPSKVATVDGILASYSTADLVASLVKKYGYAPAVADAAGEKRGSVVGQIGGMIKGWGSS
jgi:hypothetical protein